MVGRIVSTALLFCVQTVDAGFLQAKASHADQLVNATAIEQQFLDEVRSFVGKAPLDTELPKITEALRPMWLALPKNEHGRLGNSQIRYALHRFFVQRHGWHIDGLDRTNGETSPSGLLRERVPSFLMDLFEEAFGKTGLMLHELAIFAGTLEHLIHDESTERLRDVYGSMSVSATSTMAPQQVEDALQRFFMSLVLGQEKLKEDVKPHIKTLESFYPGWKDAKRWLKTFEKEEAEQAAVAEASYSFEEVDNATEQVSRQLGQFLDTECRHMKKVLLTQEEKQSGRIALSSFYKVGRDNGFHFIEKPDFLRNLGALDESKVGEPRLIVPNFLLAKSNCLVDTGFYSVCCINECESLMGQLEAKIAAPEATPEQIVKVVKDLSTSTVTAPRELPQSELLRLELAAERSGGKIALHGRLFAQWLHFVFPRECPMPQAAGSAAPLTASEWLEATEAKATWNHIEISQYLQTAGSVQSDKDAEDASIWSDEEEMFYSVPAAATKPSSGSGLKSTILTLLVGVPLGALATLAVADKLKTSGSLESCLGLKMEKPHMV
eukprot:TRINITY_DN4041_c0_g1_i1.p1 TRINITY_DN4041_c0_g1~~TRINITY_DN4041_c0_g1_i1.p1  ORF type:complete len:552 (-),score=166.70 TRINITY_DN4041_c0_g1_i1:281-1936(-)